MSRIENFSEGWIIGDFSPSILRTRNFEVGLLLCKKGKEWPSRFHTESSKYILLIEGLMVINDQLIHPGDLFVLSPHEPTRPEFLENSRILVVSVSTNNS
jgi:quercetin dioxygenase-like cupin family protein